MDFQYLSLTVILIFFYSFTAESPEPLPVMEGKGRSLKVLGFSRNQRADFVQILMRLYPVVYGHV